MDVRHLTDGELAAALAQDAPAIDELADGSVLVVRPGGAPPDAHARTRLRSLPTIVVAVDRSAATAAPAHADLVVEAPLASLDAVLATIDANPLAAGTLALLLRAGDRRDGAGGAGRGEEGGDGSDAIAAGLVAESTAYSMLQGGPELARWLASRARRQRPEETEPAVLVERVGHTLVLTLNRPRVRNAFDARTRDALLDGLAVAAADSSVTEVVLRGAGPDFCSGGDLDEFGTFADPASAHLLRLRRSAGRAIHELRGRVRAEIHGHCAGSGIELPAFAGHIDAAPDLRVSLPEVSMGLIPGAGGTVSITRRIGRHRTLLLALSGASIDAATAHRWGLVDAVTP